MIYHDHYYDGRTTGGVRLTIIGRWRHTSLRIERRPNSTRIKRQGGKRFIAWGRS